MLFGMRLPVCSLMSIGSPALDRHNNSSDSSNIMCLALAFSIAHLMPPNKMTAL